MTLLDHLNDGGCIRYNLKTQEIILVKDSQLIEDVSCSKLDIIDLIKNKLVDYRQDGAEQVYTRANAQLEISQRDREVFATLLEHWNDTDGGIPGNCSYQDLFDLCDKFQVARPNRIVEFLDWAEGQHAKTTQD